MERGCIERRPRGRFQGCLSLFHSPVQVCLALPHFSPLLLRLLGRQEHEGQEAGLLAGLSLRVADLHGETRDSVDLLTTQVIRIDDGWMID